MHTSSKVMPLPHHHHSYAQQLPLNWILENLSVWLCAWACACLGTTLTCCVSRWRISTDMRFRSAVKSNEYSGSHSSARVGNSSSRCGVRRIKRTRICAAASTSAFSSGDEALYTGTPLALRLGTTEWHSASVRKNCSTSPLPDMTAAASAGSVSAVGCSTVPPYTRFAIAHLRKTILFSVSVPVLSEKMYWICPRSSASAVLVASAGVPVSASRSCTSHSMNHAYAMRMMSTWFENKKKKNRQEDIIINNKIIIKQITNNKSLILLL